MTAQNISPSIKDTNAYQTVSVKRSNQYRNYSTSGFCIRTGVRIPFDVEKPLSRDAFGIWKEYADDDYPEKFSHFSGEPSYGETTMEYPIFMKNWKKAKELHHV